MRYTPTVPGKRKKKKKKKIYFDRLVLTFADSMIRTKVVGG